MTVLGDIGLVSWGKILETCLLPLEISCLCTPVSRDIWGTQTLFFREIEEAGNVVLDRTSDHKQLIVIFLGA